MHGAAEVSVQGLLRINNLFFSQTCRQSTKLQGVQTLERTIAGCLYLIVVHISSTCWVSVNLMPISVFRLSDFGFSVISTELNYAKQ